jgi:hypothetical protein
LARSAKCLSSSRATNTARSTPWSTAFSASSARKQRARLASAIINYDLNGTLIGVPFRRGSDKQGGMPSTFRTEDHGLRKLKVATRGGTIFASFAQDIESLEDYIGPEVLEDFDATFDGRKLRVIGYYTHSVPANWKMYVGISRIPTTPPCCTRIW